MTEPLHPHWQTTEAAEVPVRVVSRTPAAPPAAGPHRIRIGTGSVSRKPAAFVGIALVLSLGIAAYGVQRDHAQESHALTAQTSATYADVLHELAQNREPWNPPQGSAQASSSPTAPEPSAVPSGHLSPALPQNPNVAHARSNERLPATTSAEMGMTAPAFHTGAPPLRQPETGAWTLAWAGVGSAVALLAMHRRHLRLH